MKNKNQKEIREKIDKLTAEWWGEYGPAIRRQAFADQILELLKSEKAKWEKKKIIIPKGKTHPIHDRCETCVEVGREEEREKLLEKIDEIIDDNNDLLRWQKEELKDEIRKRIKGRQNK